ncbi:MAG: HEAT repeat domain-containing protein, partial [Bacteroidales bacterium]|nr:HEAT repeat domain-containing protein [Bacteroidales bacterium]
QTNSISGQETNDSTYHIVKKSENAYRISSSRKIPIDSLKLWNNLDQNYTITEGQILFVSRPEAEVFLNESGLNFLEADSIKTNFYSPTGSQPEESTLNLKSREKIYGFYTKSTFIFKIFLFVNLFFLVSSIALLLLILYTRINKKIIKNKVDKCLDRYREFITGWAFSENSEIEKATIFSEIRNKIKRDVFTTELLSLHSNLSGESADKLVDLFHRAGLKKYSIKKIHSYKWNLKAKGFRELVQMKIYDEKNHIAQYLNSKNDELRIEAQLAWIELNTENPSSFLEKSRITLTDWWQLNVLISFKKVGYIPVFGKWIENSNDSVAIFAIKMVGIFKQFESIELVIKQLNSPNSKIRFEAICTLGKLAQTAPIPELQLLFYKEDTENRAQIIKSLIMISDSENAAFFREILLNENDVSLRILSAKGLVSLGDSGLEIINTLDLDADDLLKKIIIHAKDSRI